MKTIYSVLEKLLSIVFFCLLIQNVYAVSEFVVEDIRVEGLQKITPGTVFNYLPIKAGDTFNDRLSRESVNALFDTGFFNDIKVERDGDVIIFIFEERPSIASIEFSGNEDIASEDLIDSLRQIGFAEGRSFDRLQLDKLEQELRRQYNSLGKYAVELESTITELENNTVGIAINITEGIVAEIKKINIIGNTVYKEKKLLKRFSLVESAKIPFFAFFSNKSQYSRQKLTASIEALRSYYLNAGYINFNIDSTQVSITPDKKNIYITINITEGDLFTVSAVRLTGNFDAPEEELSELVSVSTGDIFSRQELINSSERLKQYFSNDGYAFAKINALPEIDNENNTVEVAFVIDLEKRAYVRRISFSGNVKTRDEVLRREMRQQEGAWASSQKIERGKIRLQRLGFFSVVEVETIPVPGREDQIDLRYSVTETPSGNISLGLGFSQTSGITLQTSIAQNNFLGSGKKMDFSFNNSDVNRQFGFGYVNPYYTIDGISRSFQVFYRETDSADSNIVVFNSTVFGGNLGFGIPISEFNTFYTTLGYENTEVKSISSTTAQVTDFIAENDNKFNILRWSNSLAFDTRNKAILPDQGTFHQISLQTTVPLVFSDSLKFYKIDYKTQWFTQLFAGYIFSLKANISYGASYGGASSLPFFENFYAGGPRSVRGYEENTLGPIDETTDRPIGGNLRLTGGVEVILPIPFLKDIQSVRMSGFVDGGNVFGQDETFKISEFRYSVGLGMIWVSPFGLVSASIAHPFGDQATDQTQAFQFTFGTSF